MVQDILRRAGHPLHISEILTLVAKRYGVELDRGRTIGSGLLIR